MTIDFNNPSVAQAYDTGYTQAIRDHFLAIGKFLEGESPSNLVAGIKRYNATSDLFEQRNAGNTAWEEMPLAYLKLAGGTLTGTLNVSSGQLQEAGSRVWTAATFDPSTKANVSGQEFSGAISTSSGDITSAGRLFGGTGGGNGLRKITVQQGGTPPTGAQGDICFIW